MAGDGAGGGVTSGIRPGTSGVSVCNMTNKSSVNEILKLVQNAHDSFKDTIS